MDALNQFINNRNVFGLTFLIIGVIGFIVLFFPDVVVLSLILSLIALAGGITSYNLHQFKPSLATIALSGYAIAFLIFIKLLMLYIESSASQLSPSTFF